MAELPRYRDLGVRTQGVPDVRIEPLRAPAVDRVDLRAAAQTSDALSAAIDRMSGVLYREAAEQATERGMQYGLENPPSLDQVRAAIASGASPADMFVAGNSFFAQGARKTQASLMSQELHGEGMKVINGVLLDIDAGNIKDLETVKARIDGAVAGMVKPLDKVAPEEALRLRATMATLGNNAYTKAAEKLFVQQKDASKIGILSQMQMAPKILESIIERGDVADASGRTITPEMQVEVYRSQLLRSLATIGDPVFAQQQLDRFNGLVSKAKIGVVSAHVTAPEFTADPVRALQAVRAGQVGKVSSVYAALNQEEKDKVRLNMMSVLANDHTLTEQARTDKKRADEIAVNGMLIQYHGMPAGPAKRDLATRIAGMNVLPPASLKELLKPTGDGEGDPIRIAKAEELISIGMVRSLADLDRMVPGIPAKQQVELQRKIFSQSSREETEAGRILRMAAGIPDGPVFLDRASEQAKGYQALTDAFRAKEDEARRAGAPFNPVQAALEVRRDREATANQKAVSAAKTKLEAFEETAKAKGKIVSITESTSIDDLRNLKVFDEATLAAIARQQKVIKSGGR